MIKPWPRVAFSCWNCSPSTLVWFAHPSCVRTKSPLRAVREVKRRFPDSLYILIEDKANGSAVIQTLRHELPGVLPVEPRGGKTARVNAVAPAIEGGHVFLPRDRVWAEELADQFAAFPSGKHDDMVDAASQALSFLLWSAGERGQGAGEDPEERCFLDGDLYEVYN